MGFFGAYLLHSDRGSRLLILRWDALEQRRLGVWSDLMKFLSLTSPPLLTKHYGEEMWSRRGTKSFIYTFAGGMGWWFQGFLQNALNSRQNNFHT